MTSKKKKKEKSISEIEDTDELLELGNAHYNKGEFAEAIKCFKEAVEHKPDYYNVWCNIGLAYNNKGEFAEAIKCFQKAVDLKPDYYNVWCNIGLAYNNKGEFAEAIKCFQKAVDLKPDYYNAWYYMGLAYYKKEELEEAIKCFQKAVEHKPDFHLPWYAMGLTYNNKGEFVEAIKCFKEAVEHKPDYYNAWYNMGLAYYYKGEFAEAIKHYKKAVDLKPDSYDAWNNMGSAYDDKEEFDQAIKCYEEAIKHKPDDHEAWNNMGSAYSQKEELDQAIKCYEEAVKHKPDKHEAWNNMGSAYSQKEELDQAIKCYEEAVKHKPDEHEAWNNMGSAYSQKEELDQAIKCYEEAVKHKPDEHEAWNNMGIAYHDKEEFDQAIKCYQKTLAINPDNDFARKNLELLEKKDELFNEIETEQDKLKVIEKGLTKIEGEHKEILEKGESVSEEKLKAMDETLEEKERIRNVIEKKEKEKTSSEKLLQKIAKMEINELQSDIKEAIQGQVTIKIKTRVSRNIKKIDDDYIEEILENLICSYPLQMRLKKQIEHISASAIKDEISELKKAIMNNSDELLDVTRDKSEYSTGLKDWLWKAANEIEKTAVLRVFCTLFTNVLELPPVPIRILYLVANPKDERKLDPQEEIYKIEKELKSITLQQRCDFQPKLAVRAEELSIHLEDYKPDIVHFSGHGTTEGIKTLDDSRMSLIIPKDDLVDLFKLFKGKVRCVVLNACSSKELATALTEHIDCVVGMSGDIKDSAARFFAQGFYRFLARGKNIQEAVDFGRAQIGAMTKTDKEIPKLVTAEGVNAQEIVFIEN